MTKRAVRKALGFTRDRQLAEFFGVGKAAVSNWPEDDVLPEVRQWQARALRPDLFGPGSARDADGRVVAYGVSLQPIETGKGRALQPD
ncbi:helix-turn-helix domain-containing protein [Stenotrophomonas maltophilia]|uniref:helix-turn-helix domain-containing protein n=1 Tax=Stenotrophomonas maltophilia TaxID=40324 RepID=UPI001E5EBDA9|nr:helix-turn-helix domain-containing protein [Stenotrophomonas maltophilia]